MYLLLILYALCVLFMLSMFIYLFISEGIKDRKPWYWITLLVIFAPITIVAVIASAIREDYKYRNSPQQKAQRKREQLQERKEQERKATLALYHQRYFMLRTPVPEECLDVAHSLLRAVKKRKYTTLFNPLDHLHLPEDERLFVEFASQQHGCGDRSRLYIAKSTYEQEADSLLSFYYDDPKSVPAPAEERSYKIFSHIHVDDTLMGAWQALLLSQLWHVLPFWWHGLYDKRCYIFTREDLEQLATAPRKDCRKLTLNPNDYTVSPECVDVGNGCYYFTWCYWGEWGGLIRETHQVCIHDDKATILFFNKETLHHYDCGWKL